MLSWKSLTPKEIENVCLAELGSSNCNNLSKLIEKYGFVEYSYVDDSIPLKYLLTEGNSEVFYDNHNISIKFQEEYGVTNPYKMFNFDIFDHKILFKDSNGKVYLVSNPYISSLNNIENIKSDIEFLKTHKEVYGDLSKLKYEITDVSDSYYYPGKTVTIIFYMM